MVLDRGKETIGVTPLDAEPNVVLKMPGDSLLPFLLAAGMTVLFFGLLAKSGWAIGAGTLAEIVILFLWLTPRQLAAVEEVKLNE